MAVGTSKMAKKQILLPYTVVFILLFFILPIVKPPCALAFDCRFIGEQSQQQYKDRDKIINEINELNNKIPIIQSAYREIEEYKEKQQHYFETNLVKMTLYLGYQTYKEIKPLTSVSGKFVEIFDWARSKVGAYITFDSLKVGGYTPNAQTIKDQAEGEFEKQLWGKGYYDVDIKPIKTTAGDFVNEVQELKKFEQYTFDAYRAYAQTHTKLGDSGAQTEVKDTTVVLLRGKTLVEKCEAAQKALLRLKEQFPKSIAKFQSDLAAINEDIEDSEKRYQQCIEDNKKSAELLMQKEVNETIESLSTEDKITYDEVSAIPPARKLDWRKTSVAEMTAFENAVKKTCYSVQNQVRSIDSSTTGIYRSIDVNIAAINKDFAEKYTNLTASNTERKLALVGHGSNILLSASIEASKGDMNDYYPEVISLYESEIKQLEDIPDLLKNEIVKADAIKAITLADKYSGYCSSYNKEQCPYEEGCYNPGVDVTTSYPFSLLNSKQKEYTKKVANYIVALKLNITKTKESIKSTSNYINVLNKIKDILELRYKEYLKAVHDYEQAHKEKCHIYEEIDDLYRYLISDKFLVFDHIRSRISQEWLKESLKNDINNSDEIYHKIMRWYFLFDDYFDQKDKINEKLALLRDQVAHMLKNGITYERATFDIRNINTDAYYLDNNAFCKRDIYYELDNIMITNMLSSFADNISPEKFPVSAEHIKQMELLTHAADLSAAIDNQFKAMQLLQAIKENAQFSWGIEIPANHQVFKLYKSVQDNLEKYQKLEAAKNSQIYQEQIKKINKQLNTLSSELQLNNLEQIESYEQRLSAISQKYKNFAKQDTDINILIREIQKQIDGMRGAPYKIEKEQIQKNYKAFKEAYENKDISLIMSMLSPDWSSGADGTVSSSLADYLRNSFTVFDEITFNITDMVISPDSSEPGEFRVAYNLLITGYIYDENITHEEKSSVVEIVNVKGDKVIISQTLSGRFWYIK